MLCAEAKVADEIANFIGFLDEIYKAFQFEKEDIKLATRPPDDKRLGTDEGWDGSEGALSEGLDRRGLKYEVVPGEGAFYGPKIEFHVHDALKRSWQLGTIQSDSNLPRRFELSFVGDDGMQHQPVMLHRAVFGSLERFFAIYLEHCGGNFPPWLAPHHAIVLTVSEKSDRFAREVDKRLRGAGLRTLADLSTHNLEAKIRNARLFRCPSILTGGPQQPHT